MDNEIKIDENAKVLAASNNCEIENWVLKFGIKNTNNMYRFCVITFRNLHLKVHKINRI